TIPAGSNSGTYFLQGTANSGAVTLRATAPNYNPGAASDTVAPSGIIIGGPAGPGFSVPVSAGGGPVPITLSTAVLDPNTNSPTDTNQILAPGQTVSVSVSNSNPAVGAFPASVTFTGGNQTATANFTPSSTTGSTTLSV